MTKSPLQKSDDQYDNEQGQSGVRETPIEDDSPKIISDVREGNAVQKPLEPINDGTRDGYYDEVSDKDKNLHTRFVKKGASE